MRKMNERQVEILGRVLADANFYTIDKLSTIMGKSKRTIYADLNQINDYFSTEGINIFVVNESGEIDKHRGKEATKELVEKINFYDYELNVEERVTLIIILLFFSTDYITIQTIADRLYCSRTTILKDMVKVKKKLSEAGIEVISYQNKGLTIKGTELAIRKKFVQINEKHLVLLNMFLQVSVGSNATSMDNERIRQTLSQELLKNNLSLTDNSHQILENYLSFSSCRLKIDKEIQDQPTKQNDYEKISKNILAEVFPELAPKASDNEANYLAVLIQNMKFIKHPQCEDSMVTIHLLVRIFLEELSKELMLDLTHDSDLFTNLSNHLFDIFNKTYSQGIESKELIYFMEKNSELVTCIKKQVAVFENYLSRALSNVEIGYLALHISASIEKGSRVGKGLKVLLICNSGVGTSQLMKARLAHHYIFTIIDTLSIIELPAYDADKIDLIISTVDLNMMVAVPNIKVSLNVTEKDRQRIDQTIKEVNRGCLNTNRMMKSGQGNHVIQNIAPLVQQYDGLLNQLENTITDYFSNSESYVEEKLTDFITESLIDIDVQVQNWEEAVLKGTELLEKNGKVAKQFGKEIIKSLKLLGPYILLANDTAFPHAGFDQGAIATAFSFIRLTTPVSFTNDQSDSVDLIFTLSASDNQKHINALFSLLEIVNNQMFKVEIRKAKSKREIMDTIIKYETLVC